MATAPKTIVKSSKGAGGGGAAADEGGGGGGGGGKSKKKLLIMIIVAVVVLSASAAGAFLFLGKKKVDKAEAVKEEKAKADHSKPPKFVPLDPFTVNLNGEDSYLQCTLTIQVADAKQEQMLKDFTPQIRSRLLILLSGKKAAEIGSVEGKNKLVEEILEQLRSPFQEGSAPQEVDNVFITSFIIQ